MKRKSPARNKKGRFVKVRHTVAGRKPARKRRTITKYRKVTLSGRDSVKSDSYRNKKLGKTVKVYQKSIQVRPRRSVQVLAQPVRFGNKRRYLLAGLGQPRKAIEFLKPVLIGGIGVFGGNMLFNKVIRAQIEKIEMFAKYPAEITLGGKLALSIAVSVFVKRPDVRLGAAAFGAVALADYAKEKMDDMEASAAMPSITAPTEVSGRTVAYNNLSGRTVRATMAGMSRRELGF